MLSCRNVCDDLHYHLDNTFIRFGSKFYRRYYDLISKFQVGLKSLLRQGLSEHDFYGDLVYKLKKIVGSNNFSAQFIKIISHYKKIVFAMALCASVYMCFVVTCWERADLLALVCGVCCEFVTFPLVSWVRYGT